MFKKVNATCRGHADDVTTRKKKPNGCEHWDMKCATFRSHALERILRLLFLTFLIWLLLLTMLWHHLHTLQKTCQVLQRIAYLQLSSNIIPSMVINGDCKHIPHTFVFLFFFSPNALIFPSHVCWIHQGPIFFHSTVDREGDGPLFIWFPKWEGSPIRTNRGITLNKKTKKKSKSGCTHKTQAILSTFYCIKSHHKTERSQTWRQTLEWHKVLLWLKVYCEFEHAVRKRKKKDEYLLLFFFFWSKAL